MSIETVGFEDLEQLLTNMTISETDEKRAMRKAINIAKDEVQKNTPVGETGKMAEVKATVKQDSETLAIVGEVKAGAFYSIFQEYGTSKSKKHLGYFKTSIDNVKDNVTNTLAKEILSKAK